MSRFDDVLHKKAPWIMPYLTAGYPDAGETVPLMRALERGGADAIELGLPFSDPLADGPVIQETSQRALNAGITHSRILVLLREFRQESQLPVILMGYLNPILAYGSTRFFENAAAAGADALIIPDLPVDEAGPYLAPAREAGLAWIFLAAPTSDRSRLEWVDRESDIWSYCVSVAGVTGTQRVFDESLRKYLQDMQEVARKPFVVGFGISTQEHVTQVCPPARGVVIGTALLRALGEEPTPEARVRRAEQFLKQFRKSGS